jgi:hypothetical protein
LEGIPVGRFAKEFLHNVRVVLEHRLRVEIGDWRPDGLFGVVARPHFGQPVVAEDLDQEAVGDRSAPIRTVRIVENAPAL